MAPRTGRSMVSILAILPSLPMVKRSIGSLSCGETMRRPLGSTVIETQEPSPGWELRSNSTLKPSATFNDSAGVASPRLATPGALAGVAAANTAPQGCTPCFPRLVAAVKPDGSASTLVQPAVSLSETCHEESV